MSRKTVSVAYEDPRFSKKEAVYWSQVRSALDSMGAPNSGELLHNSKSYVEGVYKAGLPALETAAVIWHKHCQGAGTTAVPCVAEDREPLVAVDPWVLLEPGFWEWRTAKYPPGGYAIAQLPRKKGFELGRWDSTVGRVSFRAIAVYPSLESAQAGAAVYAQQPGGMEQSKAAAASECPCETEESGAACPPNAPAAESGHPLLPRIVIYINKLSPTDFHVTAKIQKKYNGPWTELHTSETSTASDARSLARSMKEIFSKEHKAVSVDIASEAAAAVSEANDSAPAMLNPLDWSQWVNKYGTLSGSAKIASDAANRASSEATKSSNYNAYMEAYKLHIAARTAILAYKDEARRSAESFYPRDFEDLSDARQKALVKEFRAKTDPVFDRLDQIADEHDRVKDADLKKYKEGRDTSGAWETNSVASSCVPFTRLERNNEAFQACQRIANGPLEDDRAMFRLLSSQLGKEDQEVFVVVGLDLHRNLRSYTEIARGQRDRVAVNVEDVVRAVIADGPHGFVVAHNHPSGKANPSPKDKELTDRIQKAAAIACPSVVFLDHIVVGQGEYYCFADGKLKHAR